MKHQNNHHVPLGVINPEHSHPNQPPIQLAPNIKVKGQPFRIKKRTHDLNEIEYKASLDNRLVQPRVYVQDLICKESKQKSRGSINRILLPVKHTGSEQYELTVRFYKKIAEGLTEKSQKALYQIIKNYSSQTHSNVIKNKHSNQNLFLTKNQFHSFVHQNFQFTEEQCEQFWEITYNSLRFNEKISVNAFVYNFDKFYIKLQNYANCFSEKALKQRSIDLRLLLHNWYHNWKYFYYNLNQQIQQIQSMLMNPIVKQNDEMTCDLRMLILQCKKHFTQMTAISEIFYPVTTDKYVTQNFITNLINNYIKTVSQTLKISRITMNNFMEISNHKDKNKFYITDILEYCRIEKYDEPSMNLMLKWMQGIFEYLYYHHNANASQYGLQFNFNTCKLQCKSILQVTPSIIHQYDRYLQNIYDQQIQTLLQLTALVNNSLKHQPVLQNNKIKQNIIESNYILQTLIRFTKNIDVKNTDHFSNNNFNFYANIVTIANLGAKFYDQQLIKQELSNKYYKPEQIKNVLKTMFGRPGEESYSQAVEPQQEVAGEEYQEEENIDLAVTGYNIIKQNKLNFIAAPKLSHTLPSALQPHSDLPIKTEVIPTHSNPKVSSSTNIAPNSNAAIVASEVLNFEFGNQNLSKYSYQSAQSTQQTIRSIENLESQLFDLLEFNY